MYRIGSNERADLPLAVVIGAGAMGMAVVRRLAQQHRILLADINAAHAENMAVTLRGTALVVEALLPLARQGSAAILIASLAAHGPAPADKIIEILHKPTAD